MSYSSMVTSIPRGLLLNKNKEIASDKRVFGFVEVAFVRLRKVG